MDSNSINKIQNILIELNIDAWLLYDFRGINSISCSALGLPINAHQTRRWACLIPKNGPVRGLFHKIEPHIADYSIGDKIFYSSQDEFISGLIEITKGYNKLAMEYSENNLLPVVSKVDCGTIELVRSLGKKIISSGEIVSSLAKLTDSQIICAKESGKLCKIIMMNAFEYITNSLKDNLKITEYNVQQFILKQIELFDMVTNHPPIVAVNENAANPHYEPNENDSKLICKNNLVLIDLWAGLDIENSVYGDITWVGYTDEVVPQEIVEVFNIVRDARDKAFDLVVESFKLNEIITGAYVDNVCRKVIDDKGYGEFFTHRTGHSITNELHGAGVNMDNFETKDNRRLTNGICFSIEPGIYLPNKFGIRSELDVIIDYNNNVYSATSPNQNEIIII